jgi:hypothetical protein
MTTAALKASLALWKRRYAARLKLRAKARQELLEARKADMHPRQHLVDRKILRERQTSEALNLIKRRERQIAERQGKASQPVCRVNMNVSNQSSRGGVKPKLIVLHTTEGHNRPGTGDLSDLGHYFDRPATQASSTAANDAEGNNARFMPDSRKPWTQAAYNSRSLSLEQIGFASQIAWSDAQLRSTAQWIAFWSRKHGIPITKSTTHGVCEHKHLGAAGGGHVDCGPKYPFDRVLEMARALAR